MATFSTTSFAGPRTVARRLGAATATAALVAAGVVGLGSAAHADEVTHTFWSPSGTNWTVPPGVHSIEVEVVGASGGGGDILEIPIVGMPLTGDGAGGGGGRVTATLDVTPGEVIRFFGSWEGGPVGSRHEPGTGGRGYRDGGDGNTGSLAAKAGGGGGGASAVVAGGQLIVAGGGGGGGGRGAGFAGCYGGHGGNAWMDGFDAFGICAGGGAGGSAGAVTSGHGTEGGNAGDSSSGGGGGGGGGGYRGGSGGEGSKVGGAGGGGGGGGTSYVSPGLDATLSTHSERGDGYVRITYDPTFATVTDLTADPIESVYGQPVTYSVTVSNNDTSDTPVGRVDLYQGGELLDSGTLVDGRATFQAIRLGVGSHQVRAEYTPSTGDFHSSTGTLQITVNPGATTTSLQMQPQSAVVGQQVTATATVAAVSPASGQISGEVEFSRDGDVLGTAAVIDGVATLQFAAGGAGSQEISATYLGTPQFRDSAAVARTLRVERGETVTEVASEPNPSVRGQEVTLTADIQASFPAQAEPSGHVQFYVDDQPVGEARQVQEHTAVLTTAQIPVGASQVRAEYLGDDDLRPSTSAEHLHAVERAEAAVTLDVDPADSRFGQVVRMTAEVSVVEPGAAPVHGEVEFFAGDVSLGTTGVTPEPAGDLPQSEMVVLQQTATSGVAQLDVADLQVGEVMITAVYSGNDEVRPAQSDEVPVQVTPAEVSVTAGSEPQPSLVGQETVLTASVVPTHDSRAVPTGQVTFEVDGEVAGAPVDLLDGVAVLPVSDLRVGDREVIVHYDGDHGHHEASSPAYTHTVAPGQTSTALSLDSTNVSSGDTVQLTAEVNAVEPARGTPTGTVQFLLDGQTVGEPVELSSPARLDLDVNGMQAGTYLVQATYSGAEDFAGSDSNEVELTVTESPAPADDDAANNAASNGDRAEGGRLPLTGPGDVVALVVVAALLALAGTVLNSRREVG